MTELVGENENENEQKEKKNPSCDTCSKNFM